MAGYVGCRVKPTEYDEILDRIAVDFGVTTMTRFGSVAGSRDLLRSSAIDASVHCPAFYNRAQNPDAELFRLFLEDSTSRTNLYLTDGVQSDLSATQSPSVNALREWLRRGHPLAVLAFRSRFSGRGWSEARKAWAGEWRVNDRPFYVYVFARTDAALDRTLSRLSSDLSGRALTIRFGDTAARCSASPASLPHEASDLSPPWLLLGVSTTAKLVRQPSPVLQISCALRAESPLSGLRFDADSVKYGRWTGRTFAYPSDAPAGTSFNGDSTVASKGGFRSYVSARLADDQTTRFGYFALQLVPGRIDVLPGVVALSTNSDIDRSTARQTYRFSWVVEQLLRTQIERTLPRLTYFFTVTYR